MRQNGCAHYEDQWSVEQARAYCVAKLPGTRNARFVFGIYFSDRLRARFGSGNIFAQEGSQWLLTEARSGRHGVAGDRCPAIPRSRRLGSGSSCLSITLIHSNALAASRRPRSYAALVARGTPGTPSEHSIAWGPAKARWIARFAPRPILEQTFVSVMLRARQASARRSRNRAKSVRISMICEAGEGWQVLP